MVIVGFTEKRSGIYRCPCKQENRCDAKGLSRKQTDGTLLALLSRIDRFEPEQVNLVDGLKLQRDGILKNIEKLVELSLVVDDMTAITSKLKQLKSDLSLIESDIEKENQRIKSIDAGALSDCDMSTKAGRIEAQLIIRGVVKEAILDTANKRCKVIFHNGKVIELPISENPSEDVTDAIQSITEIAEKDLLEVDGFQL